MNKTLRCFLLAGAAALAAPILVQAQCIPEPNTGCPGSLAPQCSGSSALGLAFKFACVNQGRADVQYMLLSSCPTAPFLLPPPIGCVAGCNVGVDVSMAIAVDTGFQSQVVRIPNNPRLMGLSFCLQCVDVIVSRPCMSLGQAVRVTVM